MAFGRLTGLFGGDKNSKDRTKSPDTTRRNEEDVAIAQRDRQREQEKLDKEKQLSTNEALIPVGVLEAEREPRTVECLQLKYGKLAADETGIIPFGRDYDLTGYSPNLTPAMVSGVRNLPTGTTAPRLDFGEQPVVHVIRTFEGVPYEIYAMVAERSEAGMDEEGVNKIGRRFGERHIIAVEGQNSSLAILQQLRQASLLDARPLVGKERTSLPSIEVSTDSLDQPLPEGWFNGLAKEMLTRIASGKKISVDGGEMSQEAFLQELFNCLICLPETVAKGISYGSLLGTEKEILKELRIVHGKNGLNPILKKQGTWFGDTPDGNKLGEKYVAALAPLIEKAQTPRDVMRAVTKLPEGLLEQVSKSIFS